MKSIFIAIFFLISGIAFADVPNTFEAGSAIKASEMNENFTSIDSKVDALDSRTQNVSELETKVANLEGQVETLQLLVNSVAETASTDVEFMGYTAPMVFGAVGLQEGRSACPNLYPDSKVCSEDAIKSINDWSNFFYEDSFFLTLGSDGSGIYKNLCSDYSSRGGDVSGFYLENSKLFSVSNGPVFQLYKDDAPQTTAWFLSSFVAGLFPSLADYDENKIAEDIVSIRFYACNLELTAACCK